MDDNAKQASSYQVDQEILDARGINMSVEEVATLPTCRYSERVAALHLSAADLAFVKGLRRRIKNRLASQNSRRRSVEHLRRLARELRAVRARRERVLAERRALVAQRERARDVCCRLRKHIFEVLLSRSDNSTVPTIDIVQIIESQPKESSKIITVTETKTPLLAECFINNKIERDKNIFECRIDKLVQNSVNHIFNTEIKEERDKKKVFAKTVFISNDKLSSTVRNIKIEKGDEDEESLDSLEVDVSIENIKEEEEESGVLNLSVKEKRKSHGRKQSAPRRITYACVDKFDTEDCVLDLKVKKEPE